MTKLVGTAALLALALFGVGCTESVEADDEGEEVVATTDDELRAKPLDVENLVAKLKRSDKPQTVKAQFSMPGWQDPFYRDVPAAGQCEWSAQRFDLRIEVSKVAGNAVTVKTVRINYDSPLSPQTLYVFDSDSSRETPTFTHGAEKFGGRRPGDFDRINVSSSFKAQENNGEGLVLELRFAEKRVTDAKEDFWCVRTARVLFVVKKK